MPYKWIAKSIIVNSIIDFNYNKDNIDKNIIYHDQTYWSSLNGDPINIFIDDNSKQLAQKIFNQCLELKYLCKIKVGIKPYQIGKGIPPQSKVTVRKRIYDSKPLLSGMLIE